MAAAAVVGVMAKDLELAHLEQEQMAVELAVDTQELHPL
jgi:hypothetical protein